MEKETWDLSSSSLLLTEQSSYVICHVAGRDELRGLYKALATLPLHMWPLEDS